MIRRGRPDRSSEQVSVQPADAGPGSGIPAATAAARMATRRPDPTASVLLFRKLRGVRRIAAPVDHISPLRRDTARDRLFLVSRRVVSFAWLVPLHCVLYLLLLRFALHIASLSKFTDSRPQIGGVAGGQSVSCYASTGEPT